MSILFPVPELVEGTCQIETCGNGKETVKVKREILLRDKSECTSSTQVAKRGD